MLQCEPRNLVEYCEYCITMSLVLMLIDGRKKVGCNKVGRNKELVGCQQPAVVSSIHRGSQSSSPCLKMCERKDIENSLMRSHDEVQTMGLATTPKKETMRDRDNCIK